MKNWFIGLLLTGFSVAAQASALVATNGTIRSAIPGMNNTAGYLTLTNTSDKEIVLVGGQSSIAATVELHTHNMANGMMKMERVMELPIAAGQTITFEPGGLHLMFIGLQVRDYDTVQVTLQAKDGQQFDLVLQVKSASEHQHHN
jgi:hypothetical protein